MANPALLLVGLGAAALLLGGKKKVKASSSKPSVTPSGPPRDTSDPTPPPKPDEDFETIEGLEDERIEGVYSVGKIFKQKNGKYRLEVVIRTPPTQKDMPFAPHVRTYWNTPNLTLDEARILAEKQVWFYGYPHFTKNDLLIFLHITHYHDREWVISVWKHAKTGEFYALVNWGEKIYFNHKTPQAAIEHAISDLEKGP